MERQRDAAHDPISRMQMFLIRESFLDEKAINQLEKEVEQEVQEATDRALEAAPAAPESVTRFVYSPDLDPTSSAFETQPAIAPASATDKKPARSEEHTSELQSLTKLVCRLL